jgi:hypothetical protein
MQSIRWAFADELHGQQFSFQQTIYEGINCDVGLMQGFAAGASLCAGCGA